jgi:hypothetical protein
LDELAYQREKNLGIQQMPQCKFGADEPPTQSVAEYLVHQFRLNCGNGVGVGEIYMGKHYWYFVAVIYPSNGAEPPDTKKFLQSFAVLDQSK